MEIDFAFICDYADVTGKINALGIGFDTIYARQVPAKHPLFYVVAQFRASIAESGTKNVELRLIDADGADVVPAIKGTVEVPPPKGTTETKGRIAIAFGNVEFPRYGAYSIHLAIQGRELVRIPVRVAQPPAS